MEDVDLGEVEKNKYNRWCQKKTLDTTSQEKMQRAFSFSLRTDLNPLVKSAYFFHEVTGCNGFEFIARSNIRFDEFVVLPNNAILVPWFYQEIDSKSADDPGVIATRQMIHNAEFLYDGWIAIDRWDERYVRSVIQGISETLSLFSLNFDVCFTWEPKYQGISRSRSFYSVTPRENRDRHELFPEFNRVSVEDKKAIYRSVLWLLQAKKIDDTPAHFLFVMLSLESLVRYIERSSDDSRLSVLKGKPHIIGEKMTEKEQHGGEKFSDFEDKAGIQSGYVHDSAADVGGRVKRHLELVLPGETKTIRMLFDERIDGVTLYELSHEIATGSPELLTEKQAERLNNRVADAERIANKYMLEVLRKSLNTTFRIAITSPGC